MAQSKGSGFSNVDMSVISTKREEEKVPVFKDLPKPYPPSAPVAMHKAYFEKYIEPKITGNKTIDRNVYQAAQYLQDKGVPIPKVLQGKTFAEYLEEKGMKISNKRAGGTKMPKKHIMELPTNSAQRRK